MSRQEQEIGVEAPSFEDYSGSAAENYERYFVPAIGRPLADDLVARARLVRGERVLDLACGTGVVARLAAACVLPQGRVTGVDLNPGMIAVAREAAGAHEIDWQEGRAEDLPAGSDSRDVVLCQLGLQFFADPEAALAETARVLVPGGRLLLSVPGPVPRLFADLAEALERHVGEPAASFVRQVFSLHDPHELEELLRRAGFEAVSVERTAKTLTLSPAREFLWQYVHSTPLAAAIGELGPERRAALEDEVCERWQQASRLMLELEISIALGRRTDSPRQTGV